MHEKLLEELNEELWKIDDEEMQVIKNLLRGHLLRQIQKQ